jgi:adenylate kinase family enzyme
VASAVVTQLPADARRIVVRGTSGSGKSTLACRVAEVLDVEHVELDAVFHQPGWTPLDDETFRERIASVADGAAWVACGNYRVVADLLVARADTIVLYDLPRWTVMSRIVRRTLRRLVRHEELWNGNRERWQNLVSTNPEESVIAWAWTTHADRHLGVMEFLAHPPRDDLRLIHLASTTDERRFYDGLRERAAVEPMAARSPGNEAA